MVEEFKAFPFVGQNWAARWRTGSAFDTHRLENLIDAWYNEVDDFNREDVREFPFGRSSSLPPIGHYTQMVWAETKKIGCGFMTNERDGRFYQVFDKRAMIIALIKMKW